MTPSSPVPLDDLDALPSPLAQATRRLIDRFASACAAEGLALEAAGAELGRLARAFAASPFLAEYAIGRPATFLALLAGLEHERPADPAPEAAGLLADAGDEAEARRRVRSLRNRELARIAWLDLSGRAPLTQVMAQLSALADALVAASLGWLETDLSARFGHAFDEHGEPMRLIVLAMGKLGGEELNFSSDIDLIFLYRGSGHTRGGARSVSHQEYFDRLGKRLIAFLNDRTADGFVYRVDMRLRPFGDSGPLTTSFAALEHYYQLHGRDWERYALVKARAIAAAAGDVQALEAITRPFVYRRYLDFNALRAVREMKAMINAEVAREGLRHDIKLGAGGIREIEFIGQTFQLIRGGREPRLRQRPILRVLAACAELGQLEQAEVEALSAAYRFLRTVEHRLQEVHDEQTQELPQSPLERARLAFAMGYPDWASLDVALEHHRAVVRRCFGALLAPVDGPAKEPSGTAASVQLWQVARDPAASAPLLAAAGFDDPGAAAVVLERLKAPRFYERLSAEGRARFERLIPAVVSRCAAGAHGARTFGRVAELMQAVARRSVYLALLAEHPAALQRLVDLCRASSWIARELTQAPILLDELLDNRNLFSPPRRAMLVRELDEAVASAEGEDLDRVMDVLRIFKRQQVLRVAASDLMAGFPIAEVSNHLTWIAEVLVGKALALARLDLIAKHGRPLLRHGGVTRSAGFGVIAYGKLGGLELGYASDLDLVFVHDSEGEQYTEGPKSIPNDVFFTRLAQRVIHLIATRTAAGIAYDLDIRLRPNGKSGLLVTSLTALNEYQHKDAWTWEHQALVRARSIAGSPEACERFETIRRGVLRQRREPARLRGEIAEMRERMRHELDRSNATHFDLKHGVGGITDIEFMVQYAVLRWAAQHQALVSYTDNLRLLDLIADLGLLPREDCAILHDAYFAYRAELHHYALQEVDGLVAQAEFAERSRAVQGVWARALLS